MSVSLLTPIGDWIERSERRRREEFLAASADLVELERRMRWLERNGYPVGSGHDL
ncbi:DUF3563 family protein [Paraburkholderia aspalathi]|uniref:DUF3563 family protein n=1 Tax=Paraburkholderia sp. SECH2 TaxID=2937436 RepID=UPI00225C0823|nr:MULTISPECIES: DUF3563 family protein [Paraburkholderia]MCX4159328.1 DUF3563 family protein [Paraburkholderia aspalathi]MDN7168727.1 DUF3563 family protein [Paraburkholderia sp. SECH2]MDQ6397214.1 DUF3563 family protein [Paraburkholderia aspalathi]